MEPRRAKEARGIEEAKMEPRRPRYAKNGPKWPRGGPERTQQRLILYSFRPRLWPGGRDERFEPERSRVRIPLGTRGDRR